MMSVQQNDFASQVQNAFLSSTPPPNIGGAGGGGGGTSNSASSVQGLGEAYLSQLQNNPAANFGNMGATAGNQGSVSAAAGGGDASSQMAGLSGMFSQPAMGGLAGTTAAASAPATSTSAAAQSAALQQMRQFAAAAQANAGAAAAAQAAATGATATAAGPADTASAAAPPAAAPAPATGQRPTFVNAKQYRRILKRREARALIEDVYNRRRLVDEARKAEEGKNYQHESRHRHACKRPRGEGGRFLTKAELVDYYKEHPEEDPKRFKGGDRESPTSTAESPDEGL